MGSTEHTPETRHSLAGLAAVALSVGTSVDDDWGTAQEAATKPTEESAYREALRLAGDVAYRKFGQVV
ncbi:hypothetical protein ACFRJ9_05385 [Paenarthrobacter sp. NPDC056912]|uniref:hypothetical protein n=1 Tax=Paenarthrobacter sp. NPDC056912 TaxID=3345965 RepID=UPI00366BC42A